ncbi:MAG TPA: hypothetical protein VM077_01985 [Candidatus Limnocylindrales bacterium]|nr:hypothetical protein [Candidatus Limnocylindrales bacterium]
MPRLPVPGSDDGTWGDVLNDFLSQEHNADGTQKALAQSKVTNLVSDLAGKQATIAPGTYAVAASALGGVSVEAHGVTAVTSPAFNTTAINAAITAAIAAGTKLVTFARSYHFDGTLLIGASGIRFLGASPDTAVALGYTGTGVAIQIGTDNGNAHDANEYNGPYGFTMENLTLFTVSPATALDNGMGNYKDGTYGIRDWRGGHVTLKHVRITGFDFPFWGIQSDINFWSDVTFQFNHSGVYLGPRSDQLTADAVLFLQNDRALDIDSAWQAKLSGCVFVGNGTAATNPVRIRSQFSRGASDVTFNDPWFEHITIGPTNLEAFIEVGVGDSTRTKGISVRNPLVLTGTTAEAVHAKHLIKIDQADHIEVDIATGTFLTSLDNIVKVVTNTGTSPQVSCRMPHDLTLAAPAKYLKTGSVTPAFVLVDWGSQGWGLSDGTGRESMRMKPGTAPILDIVDPLTGFNTHRMTWTTQDAGQLFIDLNQTTSQVHIRDGIGSGNDLFRVQPSTGAYIPGGVDPNALTTGESTIRRRDIDTNGISQGSTTLRVAYFTAGKTETITQVRFISGGTAAGATPTICRIGIWTADAAGALLSLVASTTNDTTLWAAAATVYTKALTASFTKVVGQRYAVGTLVVSAAATPTTVGTNGVGGLPAAEAGLSPRMSGTVAGQSNLPASVVAGSISDNASAVYVVLLP